VENIILTLDSQLFSGKKKKKKRKKEKNLLQSYTPCLDSQSVKRTKTFIQRNGSIGQLARNCSVTILILLFLSYPVVNQHQYKTCIVK